MKNKNYAVLDFLITEDETCLILDEVNARIAISKSPKGKSFIKEIDYNGMTAYVIPLGYIVTGNPYEKYELVPKKIVNMDSSIQPNEKCEFVIKFEEERYNERIDKMNQTLLDKYRNIGSLPESVRLAREWNEYINKPYCKR